MTRAAAFFDLDKTVIAKSSTLAFGRPFFNGGLINRRAVLKTAYAQLVFSLAGADAQQMERLRAQMTAMVTGWDAAAVHEIVRETLHEIVDPLVYAEAADLIEGPRTDVLAACHKDAARMLDRVRIGADDGEELRPARHVLAALDESALEDARGRRDRIRAVLRLRGARRRCGAAHAWRARPKHDVHRDWRARQHHRARS